MRECGTEKTRDEIKGFLRMCQKMPVLWWHLAQVKGFFLHIATLVDLFVFHSCRLSLWCWKCAAKDRTVGSRKLCRIYWWPEVLQT